VAVFSGYRLKQARELKRLTQAELAAQIGVAQPTIARAEQGMLQLSDSLIETIALGTGFPVGWFYRSSLLQIPEGSLLLYRKKASLKSADRAFLLSLSQLALVITEHLEKRFKRVPSTLPLLDDEVTFQEAAGITRSALGLDSHSPIANLLQRLENNGVVCIALPCKGLEDFDAFSVRIDRRPFIFLNPYRSPDRIRLTVSHELDHLIRRNPMYGVLKDVEKESFRFGAEFMTPEEAIRQELRRPVTLSSLAELKLRWGVSIAALVRRARQLGLIEDHQYKYLNIKIRDLGWKVQEPGSNRLSPERPRALRKMFELAYGDDFKALAADLSAPVSMVEAILFAHAGRTDLPIKKAAPPPARRANNVVVEFKKR
jgi:Zn-dependent peptidase ImmA (M78 family)/transcriptional regulator with XRE-family HTH domain